MSENENKPGKAGHSTALLMMDFVNAMDFDGADQIGPYAVKAAEAAAGLRDQADALGIPTLYVNDNYGLWREGRAGIAEYCRGRSAFARQLIDRIGPRDQDYFLIKPQFSGFYATNLQVLLPKMGVHRLVVAGLAVDICVLFTAADAHMRDYGLWVPSDAVAGERDDHTTWALEIMERSLNAETRPSRDLPLIDWLSRADGP